MKKRLLPLSRDYDRWDEELLASGISADSSRFHWTLSFLIVKYKKRRGKKATNEMTRKIRDERKKEIHMN